MNRKLIAMTHFFKNISFQICIATNFFSQDFFDAIVTVNVTGLLVMATLFNDTINEYERP